MERRGPRLAPRLLVEPGDKAGAAALTTSRTQDIVFRQRRRPLQRANETVETRKSGIRANEKAKTRAGSGKRGRVGGLSGGLRGEEAC